MFETSNINEKWERRCTIKIGVRSDKMRAMLVFCVVVIFHMTLVASRTGDDYEKHQVTSTTRHVCNSVCLKKIIDRILVKRSPDEEDDYEHTTVDPSRFTRRTTHRPRKPKGNKGSHTTVSIPNKDFRDYDDYESDDFPFHEEWQSLLTKLSAIENNSREDSFDTVSNSSAIDDEDLCQRWLNNREKIESSFPGSVAKLPGCPCLYPNNIFYDNQIWDEKRKKKFRWRDVSDNVDRIAIYKSGAVFCVQTLPSQENESFNAQHCCYDNKSKLLTRGSGAGTPFIVSPDVSSLLHDKVDLLPWRLCKGDFTRYNEVRKPNNDNNCEINPDDQEYQYQVDRAKNY